MEQTNDHVYILAGEDMDEDAPLVKTVAEYMHQELEEHRRRLNSHDVRRSDTDLV